MNTTRSLQLALAAALATLLAIAPLAIAQPIDPAAPSEPATPDPATAPVDADAPADLDAALAESDAAGEVDRDCLRYTGSRVSTAATTSDRRDRSSRARARCTMANGRVYTRDDLERTGGITIEEALRTLDPRID